MHTLSDNICRTKKQSSHLKVKVRLIEPGWKNQYEYKGDDEELLVKFLFSMRLFCFYF